MNREKALFAEKGHNSLYFFFLSFILNLETCISFKEDDKNLND